MDAMRELIDAAQLKVKCFDADTYPMSDFTPNFADLAAMIEAQAPLAASRDHGTAHWRTVTRSGLLLASRDDRVDSGIVLLFGLLHDSQRRNEYEDPDHGPLAEFYMRELLDAGTLTVNEDRAATLGEAMRLHDTGLASDDPTIAACWDGDRLQLQRFGYLLKNELLSTEAATTLAVQEQTACWHFSDQLAWAALGEIAHDQTQRKHLA